MILDGDRQILDCAGKLCIEENGSLVGLINSNEVTHNAWLSVFLFYISQNSNTAQMIYGGCPADRHKKVVSGLCLLVIVMIR